MDLLSSLLALLDLRSIRRPERIETQVPREGAARMQDLRSIRRPERIETYR